MIIIGADYHPGFQQIAFHSSGTRTVGGGGGLLQPDAPWLRSSLSSATLSLFWGFTGPYHAGAIPTTQIRT
jgi:hypothetical protein